MRNAFSLTLAALASLMMLGQVSAEGRFCDIACGIDLYNEEGDYRMEIVLANCGVNHFSERGFKFTKVVQESGCPCTVKAFCGYDQTGRSQTFDVPAHTSVNLPNAYSSATLECNL